MSLDFKKLRSQPTGQRGAYEELICHLAERTRPNSTVVEFCHINGDGGDGGIEAYWVDCDGSEFGYQCKFHTSPKDIDWCKLDGSIQSALISHPNIKHITVAIACDLTDHVPNRRGQSAKEKWTTLCTKWKDHVTRQGRELGFTFWGAATLENMLACPTARGLREYWFGENSVDAEWCELKFKFSKADLEERYSPDDHVEVEARAAFDGLVRDPKWVAEFEPIVAKLVRSVSVLIDPRANEYQQKFDSLVVSVDLVRNRESDLTNSQFRNFDLQWWRETSRHIESCARELSQAVYSAAENEETRRELDNVLNQVDNISEACSDLENFLRSNKMDANQKRFALFEGRAGTGKSHLLANETSRALKSGSPSILLLGTHFNSQNTLERQILDSLDLLISFETFLGTLSSAAEAKGLRGLLIIDAINESNAPELWRNSLGKLREQVFNYPNLALVISCRLEYAPYCITEAVRRTASITYVEGFTTAKEQEEAAFVYMDRRDIRRPAAPWLSPEFCNPLFLRTTCLALKSEGQDSYPTGLHGITKVLAFYLKILGKKLGTKYDGSDELTSPIARTVKELARNMAGNKRDYVLKADALDILADTFSGFKTSDQNWIDVLKRGGLLRSDPDPEHYATDPLAPPDDVVRFSYQRFQDYLVAESLLTRKTIGATDFNPDGDLSFLLDKNGIKHKWLGVFQAVWTIAAEKFDIEVWDIIAQAQPADFSWRSGFSAFLESIYWRTSDAFSDRTLELLNGISSTNLLIKIVLNFSVLDHPLNAEFIHDILSSRDMPERDAFWTTSINKLIKFEHSLPERLISWCLGNNISRATDSTVELALHTLGWFFTSSNKRLRDRATKAAIEIILERPGLVGKYIESFSSVDDPYVVERVLASVAGACLRCPDVKHIQDAFQAVRREFYDKHNMPIHLLARDYANIVVELASKNRERLGIDKIEVATPKSQAPDFSIGKAEMEARAKSVGAGTIFFSCNVSTVGCGDFGCYIIKSRMRDWSSVPLSSPPPEKPEKWGDNIDKIDPIAAGLWVANRVLELGWNEELFPCDRSQGGSRFHGAKTERIGKKYQWIAYHELMARLADNFWLVNDCSTDYARVYETPIDTEFVRDLEPTMPDEADEKYLLRSSNSTPIPMIKYDQRTEWVFEPGLAKKRLQEEYLEIDPDSQNYLTLYQYSRSSVEYPHETAGRTINTSHKEFFFLNLIAVDKKQRSTLVKLTCEKKIDFHGWMPTTYANAGYVFEMGQRETWRDAGLRTESKGSPDTTEFTFRELSSGYSWESHLDGSLPNSTLLHFPSLWLIDRLDLRQDAIHPGDFLDRSNRRIVKFSKGPGIVKCQILKESLLELLDKEGLVPLLTGIGERSVCFDSNLHGPTHIRWNGCLWNTPKKTQTKVWDDQSSS